MHPELAELQPKLKEILYDCAVEIRATKAALYLSDGAGKYGLVTEYGFRGAVRQVADTNDPVVDRCGRGRNAFFINGVGVEPRFSELLYAASTDRLLAVPLYSRGQLIGVIDMRDKAGKQPFEQPDIPKAQRIAERLVALFAGKNLFGQRFITLSNTEETPAPAPAPPPAAPVPQPAQPQPPAATEARPPVATPRVAEPPRNHVPRVATLVLEARTAADRLPLAPVPESLSEADLQAAREVLRSILLIPGAVTAMLSAFGHLGGVQEVAARTALTDDAKNFLQSKLNVWLTKRGDAGGFLRTTIQTPFGTAAAPIRPNDLQKVFTAPVVAGALRGLCLTVAFTGNPDRAAHELLAVLHAHLQLVLETSMQRATQGASRVRIAERLLEPDFSRYPELRRHTDAVARLSDAFARFLALGPAEVESARIVALVHDVGMRLLDYGRLYRKRDVSADELAILREHVAVGAAVVEPFLGPEIARAVLCHHERVDGRGYPNQLHGDDVPFLARLVQICDAYAAIVDPDSYQSPETHEDALTAVTRGAGGQFDAELAGRFVEFARGALGRS